MLSRKARLTTGDAGATALSLLEMHVDFPRVQVQMLERLSESEARATKEAAVLGSPARLVLVLERYDIRAHAYLQLVTEVAMQNAYMTMLQRFEDAAWQELTGFPLQYLRPVSGQTHADLESIRARTKRWTYAGYQQLAHGGKPKGDNLQTRLRATDWGQIEVEFLSDERIQIRIGQEIESYNYAELGFGDRSLGDHPKPAIRDHLKTGQ